MFQSVSDKAHFCFGALVVFASLDLRPDKLWWVVAIVIVLSGLKEWLYDPREETPEVAGSGWRDWFGYCLGVGVALAVHFAVNRWFR